jgi:hypothetical protein
MRRERESRSHGLRTRQFVENLHAALRFSTGRGPGASNVENRRNEFGFSTKRTLPARAAGAGPAGSRARR